MDSGCTNHICNSLQGFQETRKLKEGELFRSEEHTSELQSLPESFKEFRLNYNMNKKVYTLSELMNELVVAEGILGASNFEANVGEASTS